MHVTAQTLAPAKLNLFLELLAKRPDGYHEIDTVMVPINWTDSLVLTRTSRPGVKLQLKWLPSEAILAERLGVADDANGRASLLDIPVDTGNLVCRALERFLQISKLEGGFDCELLKQIPAGAGMGGASSDAASALIAAADLVGDSFSRSMARELAASLGSDLPFFFGEAHQSEALPKNRDAKPGWIRTARGTGRGEEITPFRCGCSLNLVVVFPGRMLSTPRVYAQSKVPDHPNSACKLIRALESNNRGQWLRHGFNRLAEPAKLIEPKIEKTVQVMQHSGLRACQMTGSGSACFGFAISARHAQRIKVRLTTQLRPGAFVRACRTIRVPLEVVLR